MSIVTVISNTQTIFPAGITFYGGALATISLIVSIILALLVSDSKYWNKWSAGTLDICTYSLLLTFAATVIFKIILLQYTD